MNKIIGITFVIYVMVFAGCEKSTYELCGGNDPANDLQWLKQEITDLVP